MKRIHQEVLDELEALNGDFSSLRTTTYKYTPIPPVKPYSPTEIRTLREQGHYTQTRFGNLFGVSLKTVQSWEAGTNKPGGSALRLFQILEHNPQGMERFIQGH
ncbi:MAG: helix-turn-helix domain-containing protein [Oscillospiraceae bacterium]|nr:helix-turn-helix domain-containing protein [Oscillospiraceae bacterium]